MRYNPVLSCTLAVGLAGCGYGSINPVILSTELQYDSRILGT